MLPIGSCVFDQRHFVYDTLDGCYPFALTCGMFKNAQIWLMNVNENINKNYMIAQINPKTRECRCFDIRKLTPTETYRLMGVSDGDIRRLMDAPLAASAHYKLAGNSIVVDVMTALFRQVWFTQQDEGPRQMTLFPEPEWHVPLPADGQPLRIATLCSGYDSQCMALERLLAQHPEARCHYDLTAWAEFDPESRRPLDQQPAVVAHNAVFPQFSGRNLGDMTKIDWKKFMEYGFEEEETESEEGDDRCASDESRSGVEGTQVGSEHQPGTDGDGLQVSALHSHRVRLNPGDIDLLTYSTPCQSISQAGKRAGIAKGSGTRSSILWNTADAIEALRPKILMQENVAALVNQENKPHFDQWRGVLSDLGYDSDYRVLNAKDFGVPQNRERVFCLSWRRDMGLPHAFPWPQPVPLTRTIADVLEPDADPRYFLRPESVTAFLQKNESEQMIYVTTDHKPTGTEIDHILCENGYNV
jgi:DNA (cytosine-5)-methyltransferase 1